MILLQIVLSTVLGSFGRTLDQDFSTAKIKIGAKTIDVYLADTNARRSRGLMYVERLPAETGMLFVFDKPQRLSFWMKNTLIPLAIGFIDAECVLREFTEMSVESSMLAPQPQTYRSVGDAKFALEMNSGWFTKEGMVGHKLKVLSGGQAISGLAECK